MNVSPLETHIFNSKYIAPPRALSIIKRQKVRARFVLFVSNRQETGRKLHGYSFNLYLSLPAINLEAHVKSLHITLAYHFDVAAYDELKMLVDDMQPSDHSSWELRLYSRDPRFANHQVNIYFFDDFSVFYCLVFAQVFCWLLILVSK